MKLKSFTFLVFISLFLSSVSAQITIFASGLPKVGDQDNRIVVNNLSDIYYDSGVGAGDEIYEFGDMEGRKELAQSFMAPEQVDAQGLFPSANLVRLSPDKFYYEMLLKDDDGLKLIGGISPNPMVPGTTIKWKLTGSYYLRNTPMTYGDELNQTADLSTVMDTEFLPDSILENLPLAIDSIKIKFKISSESEVDGFGRIYINDFKSMNVLRQDYQEVIDPRIEALTILGWIDVTGLVKEMIPEFGEMLQATSVKSYRYYSDESPFSLLEAVTSTDGTILEGINYNDNDLKTFITTVKMDDEYGYDISVSPNPSDGKINLEVKVDRPGDYTIKVMSIIGYQLWTGDYYIYDKLNEELDFRNLRRGTYFYSLVGPNGKTLVTKRMLIIGA